MTIDEVKAEFGADHGDERMAAVAERGRAAGERHRAADGDDIDCQ